MIESSVNSY